MLECHQSDIGKIIFGLSNKNLFWRLVRYVRNNNKTKQTKIMKNYISFLIVEDKMTTKNSVLPSFTFLWLFELRSLNSWEKKDYIMFTKKRKFPRDIILPSFSCSLYNWTCFWCTRTLQVLLLPRNYSCCCCCCCCCCCRCYLRIIMDDMRRLAIPPYYTI